MARVGLYSRPDDDYRDIPPGNQPPPTTTQPPTTPPPSGPGGTGGGSNQSTAPAGIPQDWYDDFIRRNPGDYGRAVSAYAPTSHRQYDSQSPQALWQAPPANYNTPPANYNTGFTSAYQGVFNDPLTKQYEQLLQSQLGLYQQQQAAMQQQAQEAAQRRAATAEAVKRLTEYANQRVAKLQGPAYTGSEQEVLRTQLLDPLERDRTAARQRALQQIGGRGFDPSSGIAQQLLQDVDRAFDEQRTRAQGTIASRQIDEQRSREQEAQQLLQYLAQLPDATARGDLDFVNYMQGLINQPGTQALTTGQILADIPTQRLNDALATMGVAPSMSGASNSAVQLLQQLQNQRYMQQRQWADYFGNIGRSFQP
jgi:hypothetical protein